MSCSMSDPGHRAGRLNCDYRGEALLKLVVCHLTKCGPDVIDRNVGRDAPWAFQLDRKFVASQRDPHPAYAPGKNGPSYDKI